MVRKQGVFGILVLAILASIANAQQPYVNSGSYIEGLEDKLRYAEQYVYNTYGDHVSVLNKLKPLRKWGSNENVGTSITTIMTLPSGVIQETYVSTNSITSVSSDSTSDTMDIDFYEGHTRSGSDLTFIIENTNTTLTGRTTASLPTAVNRLNRVRLTAPAVGNIYFHEGGATTNGTPNDLSTVHLMLAPGDIQSEKSSTAISSVDYWFITNATASVLEKTSAWAQCRIEEKGIDDTYFYPVTQWVGISDSSGTVSLIASQNPVIVVPKNYDVRLACKANTAGIYIAGGMIGYLAIIQ